MVKEESIRIFQSNSPNYKLSIENKNLPPAQINNLRMFTSPSTGRNLQAPGFGLSLRIISSIVYKGSYRAFLVFFLIRINSKHTSLIRMGKNYFSIIIIDLVDSTIYLKKLF